MIPTQRIPNPNEGELPHIAVVIPMYQAEAHVQKVLQGIPGFVRTIIVVDDCSPDASLEKVGEISTPRVTIVRHERNQGVGAAMLSGFRKALDLGAEIMVKMDSDDQMDPAYLPALVAPIVGGKVDYTKGNRFLHSSELKGMPLSRRVGNLGLSFLTKLASGYWNIFDPTNGYVAIHASAFKFLDQKAVDHRYFFETSMLVELGLAGASVEDVHIPARYGSERSGLSEQKAVFSFPPKLFRSFFRRVWVQHFVRDFGLFSVFAITGFSLLAFGVSFGLFHWIRYSNLGIGAPIGTVMLAVLPIILGVQFLLQAIVLDVQGGATESLQGKENRQTVISGQADAMTKTVEIPKSSERETTKTVEGERKGSIESNP